ncbi:MAG: SDR family oxidoreductase [Archangium sp.]|nr:SDR family oxidoreductase [Archangium sp.]
MTTLGSKSTAEQALQGQSLAGKTAIVTGATSGIGTETARVLALAGANVVFAVRSVKAGEELAAQLKASLPATAGTFTVEALDLGDLNSVRAFVKKWLDSGRAIHLLVNNAGIMATPQGTTPQGFELQVGTNHIGHFVLTTGLLPALEKAGEARIVTVSSDLHKRGNGQRLVSALQKLPTDYSPFGAYGDSKLANVLFVKALAKRLPKGVEAFSLHPGVIKTNLTRSMGLSGTIFRVIGGLFMKSIPQGAATSVFAATAPELKGKSGAYLADCHVVDASKEGVDAELAEKVWKLTETAAQA